MDYLNALVEPDSLRRSLLASADALLAAESEGFDFAKFCLASNFFALAFSPLLFAISFGFGGISL